jgi:hypothetical protein
MTAMTASTAVEKALLVLSGVLSILFLVTVAFYLRQIAIFPTLDPQADTGASFGLTFLRQASIFVGISFGTTACAFLIFKTLKK